MFKNIALFALAFSVVGLVGCETETAPADEVDVTVEPAEPVTEVEVDSTMMEEGEAMMEEGADAIEAEADSLSM